jgi:hypothetical protein
MGCAGRSSAGANVQTQADGAAIASNVKQLVTSMRRRPIRAAAARRGRPGDHVRAGTPPRGHGLSSAFDFGNRPRSGQ